MVIGDTRVFVQAQHKPLPNTVVHLLVDMSGSMSSLAANGRRHQDIAREAALALALALEDISGVNPAVTFFANDKSEPVYSVIEHGQRVLMQESSRLRHGDRPLWLKRFGTQRTSCVKPGRRAR
jgi:nitric oxide reductase activation protein